MLSWTFWIAACNSTAGMRRLFVFSIAFASLLGADSGAPPVKAVSIRGSALRVDLATQVGRPFDNASIERDVRRLWSTGRFSDIRVERADESGGAVVIFRVVESRTRPLHKIDVQPSTYGLQLSLPEGTPMDQARAHQIAAQARDELKARGFGDPAVSYRLAPFTGNEVDLRLDVTAGERVRVDRVEFRGDRGLEAKDLRGALQALHSRRVIPPLPGLSGGWRLLPAYSTEAVQSDLARLESLYLSKGFLDASVRLDDARINRHRAAIAIRVEAGPRYRVREASIASDAARAGTPGQLCPTLLAARRDAERQGILDFNATVDVRPAGGAGLVDLNAALDRGRPYRVGRIDFSGNRHYSEAMLRRTLLLDEGQLLDERRLRESVARLNRSMLFDPVGERDVHIRSDQAAGVADVLIQLRERKGGGWNLSGPVGPASFAGPLEGSLRSRLPSWGSGLFELATYTAAISLYAFAGPLAPVLSASPKHALLPVLALQRPFLPGEGWRSGFYIAPQLGWRALGAAYATTQLQQRLLPRLTPDRGLSPELAVTMELPRGEARMFCEPPAPRWMPLRTAAGFALRFAGALTGL